MIKVQRLKQLVVMGEPDEVGESIQDTYEDLSVYGIIAQIVQRKKWVSEIFVLYEICYIIKMV